MLREKFNWPLVHGIEARLSESSYGRQRAIYEQEQMLLILHRPPKPESKARENAIFLREADGHWWLNGLRNSKEQLPALLQSYRDKLEEHELQYQNALSADDLFITMESFNPLLRAMKNFDLALQSARELLEGDKFILSMRDQSNELLRNFELLGEEMKLALDHRIAKNAEAQNQEAQKMAKAQHKLNLMAAITFPLMALSSMAGMSFIGDPKDFLSGFFLTVVATGICAGVLMVNWINKD